MKSNPCIMCGEKETGRFHNDTMIDYNHYMDNLEINLFSENKEAAAYWQSKVMEVQGWIYRNGYFFHPFVPKSNKQIFEELYPDE